MQLQGTVSVILAKAVNPNAVIPSGFCGFTPSNMQHKVSQSENQGVAFSRDHIQTNTNTLQMSTMPGNIEREEGLQESHIGQR